MTIIFNIVLPILIVICVLAVVYFLLRALSQRNKAGNLPYSVGRQEARQQAQMQIIRAILALALALFLLLVVGIGPRLVEAVSVATPTPEPTLQATNAPTQPPTLTPGAATPEATPTSPVPTNTPEPTPTITPTPEPPTARVSSGVGVWLRAAPGVESEQIAWLLDGTVLRLLERRETADDLEWQEVQAPDGTRGWVAAEFITITQPQPES